MIKSEKGFTLVELIATITIMLIIVSIAIPTSIKFINDGKEKEYDLVVDKIEVAAQEYYRENTISGDTISLSSIIDYIDLDEKYFKGNMIKDPRDDNMCLNGEIILKNLRDNDSNIQTFDKYEFTYQDSSEEC